MYEKDYYRHGQEVNLKFKVGDYIWLSGEVYARMKNNVIVALGPYDVLTNDYHTDVIKRGDGAERVSIHHIVQ